MEAEDTTLEVGQGQQTSSRGARAPTVDRGGGGEREGGGGRRGWDGLTVSNCQQLH